MNQPQDSPIADRDPQLAGLPGDKTPPQDRSRSPSLFEELIKFQREHGIEGADADDVVNDVVAVVSSRTQLFQSSAGTKTTLTASSAGSCDRSNYDGGGSLALHRPSSSSPAPPLFLSSPMRSRDISTPAPPSGTAARRGSSSIARNKQGVYRQPLCRSYYHNKRDEEDEEEPRSSSSVAVAPSISAANGDFRVRRASAPAARYREGRGGDEHGMHEPVDREGDTTFATDEALARRLQYELNTTDFSDEDESPPMPRRTASTTTPASSTDSKPSVLDLDASSPHRSSSSIHNDLVCDNSRSGANSSKGPSRDPVVTRLVQPSKEESERKDLEAALYISRQEFLSARPGRPGTVDACYQPECPRRQIKSPLDNETKYTAGNSRSIHCFETVDCQDDSLEESLRRKMEPLDAPKTDVSRTYNIVTCQGCQERIPAPLDYELVYCQQCGTISSVTGGSTDAL